MSEEHVIRLDMSGYPERFRRFDEVMASSPSLLARAERAEAERDALRLLLTESMFFVGYAEQAGATHAQLFREQVAAALTPYNEGGPEPFRVSPVPDTREESQ